MWRQRYQLQKQEEGVNDLLRPSLPKEKTRKTGSSVTVVKMAHGFPFCPNCSGKRLKNSLSGKRSFKSSSIKNGLGQVLMRLLNKIQLPRHSSKWRRSVLSEFLIPPHSPSLLSPLFTAKDPTRISEKEQIQRQALHCISIGQPKQSIFS